ncbi:unnamed protein product [Ixodes persulcatus]
MTAKFKAFCCTTLPLMGIFFVLVSTNHVYIALSSSSCADGVSFFRMAEVPDARAFSIASFDFRIVDKELGRIPNFSAVTAFFGPLATSAGMRALSFKDKNFRVLLGGVMYKKPAYCTDKRTTDKTKKTTELRLWIVCSRGLSSQELGCNRHWCNSEGKPGRLASTPSPSSNGGLHARSTLRFGAGY